MGYIAPATSFVTSLNKDVKDDDITQKFYISLYNPTNLIIIFEKIY